MRKDHLNRQNYLKPIALLQNIKKSVSPKKRCKNLSIKALAIRPNEKSLRLIKSPNKKNKSKQTKAYKDKSLTCKKNQTKFEDNKLAQIKFKKSEMLNLLKNKSFSFLQKFEKTSFVYNHTSKKNNHLISRKKKTPKSKKRKKSLSKVKTSQKSLNNYSDFELSPQKHSKKNNNLFYKGFFNETLPTKHSFNTNWESIFKNSTNILQIQPSSSEIFNECFTVLNNLTNNNKKKSFCLSSENKFKTEINHYKNQIHKQNKILKIINEFKIGIKETFNDLKIFLTQLEKDLLLDFNKKKIIIEQHKNNNQLCLKMKQITSELFKINNNTNLNKICLPSLPSFDIDSLLFKLQKNFKLFLKTKFSIKDNFTQNFYFLTKSKKNQTQITPKKLQMKRNFSQKKAKTRQKSLFTHTNPQNISIHKVIYPKNIYSKNSKTISSFEHFMPSKEFNHIKQTLLKNSFNESPLVDNHKFVSERHCHTTTKKDAIPQCLYKKQTHQNSVINNPISYFELKSDKDLIHPLNKIQKSFLW